MNPLRVCIAARNTTQRTETFVRAHFDHLPFKILSLQGNDLVQDVAGVVIPELGTRGIARYWSALKRRATGRKWDQWCDTSRSRWMQNNQVDVVLAEFGPMGALIMDSCRAANVPLVVHFHGYDAYSHVILDQYRDRYRDMFQYASAVIGVSTDMCRQLVRLGAPSEKVKHICYGVDVTKFEGAEPNQASARFVAVGRFVEKKAPHLTLLAFSKVCAEVPEARLVFVGDGELYGPSKQLARALGIADKVEFRGGCPPQVVQELMRNSRAFVQHSIVATNGDAEGTPVAVIEAQATGLPVVGTRHMGIADVVQDGVTGFLVDEQDVDGMAHAMTRLATDAALAGRLGANGRERALAEYTLDRSIGLLAQVLRDAAARQ
ncbi:glycosyltransferase [Cyanobium sp. Cruz-8H5]|uniref:glycosyltransferase n=1 Tax=Cyanobium sp. Cruz-8H5 TaxID=2823712 RepID=UPI0020CE392A|nr:glycosyltransferase [Cyanobium sp. Cruz-8H5]MCP9861485.1 glycosyltransferase [Cyanobium sp. Cruz-8H5]